MKFRNGSAGLPIFSAAIPTAPDITRICRMLKLTEVCSPSAVSRVLADSPSTLAGTMLVTKASQDPWVPV